MKQGRIIKRARVITLCLVFVAVIVSLAFDSGLGMPSSFGVGEFFLLCPLGAIEAFVASKSFVPVTLISLAVVVAFTLFFGRAWCAWGCPAPAIRRFFKRDPKPSLGKDAAVKATGSSGDAEHAARSGESETAQESARPVVIENAVPSSEGCPAAREAKGLAAVLSSVGRDKRTWVLVGVLAVTFVAGFPFFCLVCPIGLTFGTVGSLWHLIVDKQVTLSCVVFPAALVIELVIYRKWCLDLCPIAGLLNLAGHVARTFRPSIDASTCLRQTGAHSCSVCQAVCSEGINLHAADASIQLAECTRCGECVLHCPTESIAIKVAPSKPIDRSAD